MCFYVFALTALTSPNLKELIEFLQSFGADIVLTEEQFYSSKFRSFPLALNCIGGKNATELSRSLADGGTMVTYGGMSRKPLIIPTGKLIFNDIKLKGFWMTRWNQQATLQQRKQLLQTIAVNTHSIQTSEQVLFSHLTNYISSVYLVFILLCCSIHMCRK